MAPVKISYVVSFSSQDPRYPVENLLCEDSLRPWLGCPQDHSRQLTVELQLERASSIGYVDVGNCGSAFLQMEVGRSSWPPGRPYLTLVPCVALMTPADSKLEQNRCGVRMFKEADFPALVVGQKWDRLRLTCSQPFSRRSQFGLSFLRVRTPLDAPQHPQRPPPSQQGQVGTDTFSVSRSSREEEQLKSHLRQLEPGSWSPSCLSRPARMVLSAARSRALRPRTSTGTPGVLQQGYSLSPSSPGSTHDVLATSPRSRRQPDNRQRANSTVGRSLAAASRTCRSGGRARAHSHWERRARSGDSRGDSSQREGPPCPICSGHFSWDLLPSHASSCGEEDVTDAAGPSSHTWVSCPICGLPFGANEVERHASGCGEPAGTLASLTSR
ncbi:TRPC2 protein, partial [Baryphthengus martii]|nr:TRPC2 protein [Baryphthengus martii]